jgi:hypothetical protein
MDAEGWNTIPRSWDSSCCAPLSFSHRVVCGGEAEECITLFPFARQSSKPVCRQKSVRAHPSETGGKQLSYHDRIRGAAGSAHELLHKLPGLPQEEELHGEGLESILTRDGPRNLHEALVRSIVIRGFWRSIIKFTGRQVLKT